MKKAEDISIELMPGISIISETATIHSKADEEYIEVQFPFEKASWNLWIPIYYRRTGLFLDFPGKEELNEPQNSEVRDILYDYLNKVYTSLPKSNNELTKWKERQIAWWDNNNANASVTVDYFKGTVQNAGEWMCTYCLQPGNSNPQRRIQALKDYGFTIATKTKCICEKCQKAGFKGANNRSFVMMVPIEKDGIGNGYEQWSPTLREKIIRVLGGRDAATGKKSKNVLPDHKFPEIRWHKTTKAKNLDNMTEEQIREKFQLLTNQSNEAKREACRKCRQSKKRPHPQHIEFYYDHNGKGTSKWNAKNDYGPEAEAGCVGCCWYDYDKWWKELNKIVVAHRKK